MATPPATFSESWHRIAEQRIALRRSVEARRQWFRGELYHVLEDPFSNQFYRLRAPAYDFVARLRPDRTVEQAWQAAMAMHPDTAPGQEEVLQLLAQLFHANLLQFETAGDSEKLFERYKERKQKELQSKLMSVMFMRIPVLDPDRFLQRTLPALGWLFSWWGVALWLAVVGGAVKVLIDHFDAFRSGVDNVLAPGNLLLLYAGLAIVKVLHEFGHAYACRRYGGPVHVMGLMLLIFSPMPYVDATASWAFREKWKRVLVGAAGMIVELFVAAIAVFVWANTSAGVVHGLAYNMIFVASVSTILFNANPLLRYDGYYILSDLLEIPNLHSRSMLMARHLIERHLFGVTRSTSPARSRREAVMLAVFFVCSGVYRIILFAGIILFISQSYLVLGAIMAAVCIITWVIKPLVGLVTYLSSNMRIARQRTRAVLITVGAVAALALLVGWIPFPRDFRAPGVVQSQQYSGVFAGAPGYIAEILAPSGSEVKAGQPLVKLSSRALELDLASATSELEQTMAEKQRALATGVAIRSIEARMAAVEKRLEQVRQLTAALTVSAPQDGTWFAPELDKSLGLWLRRGAVLGQIVRADDFYFSAVIPQSEAAELFSGSQLRADVRITGQAEHAIPVTQQAVIPADQQILPSAALGWMAGGEVAVSQQDETGRRAAEPFFEVRATLAPATAVLLRHGEAGRIRFRLPAQPLWAQWERAVRQLLQKTGSA